MRRGELRALKVKDCDENETALGIRHHPDTDTALKNRQRSERDIAPEESVADVVKD